MKRRLVSESLIQLRCRRVKRATMLATSSFQFPTASSTAERAAHLRFFSTTTPTLCSTPSSSSSGAKAPSPPSPMPDRDTVRRAMGSGDMQDLSVDAAMASMESGDGFTEQHTRTPGYSEEDAFGATDPLMAVEDLMRESAPAEDETAKEAEESMTTATTAAMTASAAAETADTEGKVDHVSSSRNRRRNRRKRSVDVILGDVLHDALRLRDMGEKPTTDFVYKRTQERMYEEEYGHKRPSASETAAKYIPFPPDFYLHRLLPLYDDAPVGGPTGDSEASRRTDGAEGEVERRPSPPLPVYTKNQMNETSIMAADPWPERAVTPENPVWSRGAVEEDKQRTNGRGLREWEVRMFDPREGYDLSGEFLDALDELSHWEVKLLTFLRDVPIGQRRSLPFLHEWYRLFVHRLIRAERRYIRIRDVLLPASKASHSIFARTEMVVEEVRGYYAETHRALASPNYDVMRMKKSVLAPILRMSSAEFKEWQEVQRQRRNALVADLS